MQDLGQSISRTPDVALSFRLTRVSSKPDEALHLDLLSSPKPDSVGNRPRVP
jgi:hypothetical protein